MGMEEHDQDQRLGKTVRAQRRNMKMAARLLEWGIVRRFASTSTYKRWFLVSPHVK